MMTFQAQATIARPADEVWAFAADILRHPQWMTVTDARVLSGPGTQVGARGLEGMSFGPFHWDIEFDVAEAERGRRIVWLRYAVPRFAWTSNSISSRWDPPPPELLTAPSSNFRGSGGCSRRSWPWKGEQVRRANSDA